VLNVIRLAFTQMYPSSRVPGKLAGNPSRFSSEGPPSANNDNGAFTRSQYGHFVCIDCTRARFTLIIIPRKRRLQRQLTLHTQSTRNPKVDEETVAERLVDMLHDDPQRSFGARTLKEKLAREDLHVTRYVCQTPVILLSNLSTANMSPNFLRYSSPMLSPHVVLEHKKSTNGAYILLDLMKSGL
jgi:hypothetical protein